MSPLPSRFLAVCLVALASCGYGPARDVMASGGPIAVSSGTSHVADPMALEEAVVGARSALSREGALGEGGSRLSVSVLALDEGSSGIADRGAQPLARGTTLTMTGSARLERGSERIDLGEVTMSLSTSSEASTSGDMLRRDDAVRELARRVGRELGARALQKAAENGFSPAVAPTGPR